MALEEIGAVARHGQRLLLLAVTSLRGESPLHFFIVVPGTVPTMVRVAAVFRLNDLRMPDRAALSHIVGATT